MKRFIFIILVLFLSIGKNLGQETLNTKYDGEDLMHIFKMSGIETYKFSVNLKRNEFLSLSYRVYADGELKFDANKGRIKKFLSQSRPQTPNPGTATQDTTFLYRVYLKNEADSLLRVNFVNPGLVEGSLVKLLNSKVSEIKRNPEIDKDLPRQTDIISYCGYHSRKSMIERLKAYAHPEGVGCSFFSVDDFIKQYDVVVVFSIEKLLDN